jgi:two-component system sensor histidine kinase BaeS
MMRTLRSRLIVSHVLPILLIVPLVGIALIYILETQVLLAALSDELVRQAILTATLARSQPAIWSDAGEAQRFVALYGVRSESQIMLLDPHGRLLAASQPSDTYQVGQPLDLPNLSNALAGQEQVQVGYVQSLRTEVVQVLVPVVGPDQHVIGVIHLSQQVSNLQGQFSRLRTLILGVLGGELVLGMVIGLALALNLGRSLRQVTEAIDGVATGRQSETLPEQGPEEIRTLLRAFNTLIERLHMLEESRRHLLANLVHELGRPLGALQSGLQALLSGADQDPALRKQLLEGMDTQVRRLRPLLDTLADLHGQVLGILELNRQPIVLSDWLRRTVISWRQVAQEKGLGWQTAIPDSLPMIEIDPDRMAQVLGNLLSNAIKYSPEGIVSVEAQIQNGDMAIVVADTGIGIAPEEQDRIFEPFYRSRRDKRFPQGMGLGLSIARDLVLAHGGRIEVESAPGEGSRFTVRLPIDQRPSRGLSSVTSRPSDSSVASQTSDPS